MAEKQTTSQLRKVAVWFHNQHPELTMNDVLDLIEQVINDILDETNRGETEDGMVKIRFNNVPWTVSETQVSELANMISEMMMPSNTVIH